MTLFKFYKQRLHALRCDIIKKMKSYNDVMIKEKPKLMFSKQ